jgi:hypothetical protein
MASVLQKFKDMTSGWFTPAAAGDVSRKATIVMLTVAAIFLVALLVAYIVYKVRQGTLKSVAVLDKTIRLFDGPPYTFDGSKLPSTLNGQEYSFSFWIFMRDYQASLSHPLLLARGSTDAQGVAGSTPIVFMDKNSNKLHVSIKTTRSTSGGIQADPANQAAVLDQVLDKANGYLTATIDYVPLTRWVLVAFTVQDSLLSVYLDRDLYTVANLSDMPGDASQRPVFSGSSGSVAIGATSQMPQRMPGYVAKAAFYNYALSRADVAKVYGMGPQESSALSRLLGVPAYGVRWPVYRIDA